MVTLDSETVFGCPIVSCMSRLVYGHGRHDPLRRLVGDGCNPVEIGLMVQGRETVHLRCGGDNKMLGHDSLYIDPDSVYTRVPASGRTRQLLVSGLWALVQDRGDFGFVLQVESGLSTKIAPTGVELVWSRIEFLLQCEWKTVGFVWQKSHSGAESEP